MEQNKNMMPGFDPRSVANAILDICDGHEIELSNLSLHKVMFFGHTDYLLSERRPLINVNFEAWQFGPVAPVLYHQFKIHGRSPITSRAYRLCPQTGGKLVADYSQLSAEIPLLAKIVQQYGTMSPSALVSLSHARGGAWDMVWNSESGESFGLAITNEHIVNSALSATRINPPNRSPRYVN